MLCITAGGRKLPLYIIPNRKTMSRDEVLPKDVIVRAQRSGWMTADLMEGRNAREGHRGAQRNPPSTLVFYAFRGYLSEELRVKLERCIRVSTQKYEYTTQNTVAVYSRPIRFMYFIVLKIIDFIFYNTN
jgi:hypothetical protein